MTDKITDGTEIISDTEIERVKKALFNGEKLSISTCVFEKIIDRLEFSEQQLKRKEEAINQLEKIAEKYQTEFEKDALSLPAAIESIIERKEAKAGKYKQALLDISNFCNQINTSVAGEDNLNERWVEEYLILTERILNIIKGIKNEHL